MTDNGFKAEEMAPGQLLIELQGEFTRGNLALIEKDAASVSFHGIDRIRLDLSRLEHVDSAGLAFLSLFTQRAHAHNLTIDAIAPPPDIQEALAMLALPDPDRNEEQGSEGLLVWLAERTLKLKQTMLLFTVLTADTVAFSLKPDIRTKRVRKDAVWMEAERIGLGSLPIVALISLLVGLVVALQSAYQLRQFGANIYVANLIAVSMTREMGPLMTAIILAGRSGAAIAAEIATMMVTEEVSALKTMGLNPVRYIVVPKFKAITWTMPALAVFASFLGIIGGYIISILYLELGTEVFFNQVLKSLIVKDLVTGVIKSIAFAWIIVLISSFYGFRAYGGAESVGRVTTQSVVASIFWVIVADAGFSLLFYFG
jgi:phospholipid/cholesterol/gamma-HCH transport system permease protein